MTPDRIVEQLQLLPAYLAHHVVLTLAALAASIAVCVPLGLLAVHVPRLRAFVLTAAGVLQTVPGIALLALMVVLLGQIGFLPAFIALVLYSMLPIVRNTVTGLTGVDPPVIEAAHACGMTPGQVLWDVRLPIALPVIIAGIRTSAVWIVGTATLSTPVGATSLGNFIFSGLQTQNPAAVLVGCLSAAALAIVLDLMISAVERSFRTRPAGRRVLALGALGVAILASVIPLVPAGRSSAPVVIGAKTFTEQYILASVLEARLSREGFEPEVRAGMGSTVLFEALASGAVDCYVDYSGTLWTNVLRRTDSPGRSEMLTMLRGELADRFAIRLIGPLGFANAYALAMRRETAAQYGIRSLEDLAGVAHRLRMGSDYEFYARPEWKAIQEAYGLDFLERLTFDPTLMYAAVAEGRVDVISAYSTDGRIVLQDLVVLNDPRQALPPYDAVLLCSAEAARRPGLIEALERLVEGISDQDMRTANKLVDIDGLSPAGAAAWLRSR